MKNQEGDTTQERLRGSDNAKGVNPASDENSPQMESDDPFKVRLQFSAYDYMRTLLLLLTLAPIRLVIFLLCLVVARSICYIGMINMDLTQPLTGWRKALQQLAGFFARLCVWSCGLSVSVVGHQADHDTAPVLVAAPHSSFFDSFAIFWSGIPYMVSRAANREIPLVGKGIQFCQGIFVERECQQSREECKAEIRRRVEGDSAWGQFFIFPEGTTSNRKALCSFKVGGFLTGHPVQPILLRYKVSPEEDTVSWTWDQEHSAITCLLLTLCRWNTEVEMEFLPPYLPDQLEQENPALYASNVRSLMAEALQVPLCDLTVEQIKTKYGGREKSD